MRKQFKAGDWVVYRKHKCSASPGHRAKLVSPSTSGETYWYAVEKYWIVDRVLPDGSLKLRTRRGKQHSIAADDFNLRRANWFERLFLRDRFTGFEPCKTRGPHSAPSASR